MSRFGQYVTRKGQWRPFITALVVALLLLPPIEALAFFAATGTGTITPVQGATNTSTVTLSLNGAVTYPSGQTNFGPGQQVTIPVQALCTAGCPAFVSTVNLGGWSSNKTGCDSTTLAGQFTAPTLNANVGNIGTGSPVGLGNVVVSYVNLAGVNQNACSGATFTFTLSTP